MIFHGQERARDARKAQMLRTLPFLRAGELSAVSGMDGSHEVVEKY